MDEKTKFLQLGLSFAGWAVNYYDKYDSNSELFGKYNISYQGYHELEQDTVEEAFNRFLSELKMRQIFGVAK